MGVLDDIKSRRQQLFGQAVQNVQQDQAPSSPTPTAQVNGQTINQQQIQDAVTGYMQGVQQRRAAQQQQAQAANRHQYSADPMNNLFAPGNTQVQQQQPQQSSGTVNQAGAVNTQPQVQDMNGLLELLARDSKQKLDEATETPEEKAAREKREKNQRLLATIGDGLGAFHEAYSHMMGQKPMTSGSLTAAQEARVKALGLERDKKYSDALSNYVKVLEQQRKGEYYNSIAETRRAEQQSRDAARKSKESREQEKLNLQKLLREDKQRSQAEKSSFWDAYWYARDVEGRSEEDAKKYASDYSFKIREQENANAQAESEARVNATNAQANQRNAAAHASNARAANVGAPTTTVSYKEDVKDSSGKKVGTKTTTTRSRGGGGSSRSSSKGSSGNKNKKRKSRTQA